MKPARLLAVVSIFGLGCAGSSASTTAADASVPADSSLQANDAADAADASIDKSASCAATFGSGLTSAFGRLDGTVVAVVPPAHPTCAQPNSTHLVLQVASGGAVYRMVLDVWGNPPDPTVSLAELESPLAGPAWADGWRVPAPLDYVQTLHIKSTSFAPHPQNELVALVTDALDLGAKVSVYATSTGGSKADSAHLIHRNLNDMDGAIVLRPDQPSAHYLLFRFADQRF